MHLQHNKTTGQREELNRLSGSDPVTYQKRIAINREYEIFRIWRLRTLPKVSGKWLKKKENMFPNYRYTIALYPTFLVSP